jgi:hypothetical protein
MPYDNDSVPLRYIPKNLTRKDKITQRRMLRKSRKLYKSTKKQYYTRKPLASYKNKTSKHILKARRLYKLDHIMPSGALAKATGCSLQALKKIVSKGEGAYFSSGSRPNQTAQSWGLARLASAVTGGKAAAVDYKIIDQGCNHKKAAYRLAKKAKAKGIHRVPQVRL